MEIKVQAFESLDSTNDHLKKLASEGAPEGTVVIADAQTARIGVVVDIHRTTSY